MGKAIRWFFVVLGVLVVAMTPDGRTEEEGRVKELEPLLQQAIDHYAQKEYRKAEGKLNELIAQDPTSKEAFLLREVVGQKILVEMVSHMHQGRDLGDAPVELLKRAKIAEQADLRTPEKISEVVTKVVNGDTQALFEIKKLGQYAVPELVKHLRNKVAQSSRVNASYTLSAMGSSALDPLLAALDTQDKTQRQSIIQVLEKLQPLSIRSVPRLQQIFSDPEEISIIKELSGRLLTMITGESPDTLLKPAEYYFLEANRYYLGGDIVDDEVGLLNETIWYWNQETGDLTSRSIPTFLLASIKAEECAFRGMMLAPDDGRFPVLIASIYFQQSRMIKHLIHSLQSSTLHRPDLEKTTETLKLWEAHMEKNLSIASSIGSDRLATLLSNALLDHKPDVAVEAIKALEISLHCRDLAQTKDKEPSAKNDQPGDYALLQPLFSALASPNRVVSVAAANCLIRIGYPSTGAHYNLLLPKLIEGTTEDAPPVLLLISNNLNLCREYERILSPMGIQVETATSGRNGLQSALRFPPKDAILIDGSMDEFSFLQSRLDVIPLAKNSVLPMTIITSRERAANIVNQFNKKAYTVEVIADMKPDTPNLFEKLTSRKTQSNRTQVFVLTNESRDERERIRQVLVDKVQSLLNPMNNSSVQISMTNDSFANIFLDEELSGYDAKRTLISLRSDPRTRETPVGILFHTETKDRLTEDFADLLKDSKKLSLVSLRSNGDDLAQLVKEMSAKREAIQANYVRQAAVAISSSSSAALSLIKIEGDSGKLTPDQAETLKEVLRTRADETTRINTAIALGHFREVEALPLLAKIVEDDNTSALRTACLTAIGEIDQKGTMKDFKLRMLKDNPDPAIQAAAASGLSRERPAAPDTVSALVSLRVSDPRNLSLTPVSPPKADAPAEGAENKEGEEAASDKAPNGEQKTEAEVAPAEGEEAKANEEDTATEGDGEKKEETGNANEETKQEETKEESGDTKSDSDW